MEKEEYEGGGGVYRMVIRLGVGWGVVEQCGPLVHLKYLNGRNLQKYS